MKALRDLPRVLLRYLKALLYGWIVGLARLIRRCRWRRRAAREDRIGERGFSHVHCAPVPERIYRRPDPLIYSQQQLMAEGLGVTWDNPDIQLLRGGVPVSSSELVADEEYEVEITVWNGSTEAPAAGLPVRLSYLDFGIGAAALPVGETTVDLPVKGAPGHPATASLAWRTPPTPGHYCLRAELVWIDDANPANNVGQENTDVVAASSPARFDLTVRNTEKRRRRLRLEADAYTPPPLPPCSEEEQGPDREERDWPEENERRREARRQRRCRKRDTLARHERSRFPIPDGWTVRFDDPEPVLGAEETRKIAVEIEPPPEFMGSQPINVNAFAETGPAGGVTVYVER